MKPPLTFRQLSVGDKFHIINTNFSPPKVMTLLCTKERWSTYSHPRPSKPTFIDTQKLRSDPDDFLVVRVAAP